MSSGTQGHQYSNHGSSSQYVASGNQNINTGSGSQYNADIINFNYAHDSDASLLNDLYVTDPTADKIRIERTKGGILRDSYSWILGHPDFRQWQTDAGSRLLWVKGDPGKGKTMLLCGIIDELEEQKKEPVFFFCQATDGRLNTANAVLRGLLYMLLKRRPSLLKYVREEHKHAGKQLFEDANGWDSMCKILASMLAETNKQLDNIIFLIDDLDECTEGLDELLNFILKLSFSRTKIIVFSRNWPSIEEAMEAAEQKVPIWLELNDDAISTAVLSYIKHKVDELAQKKKYDAALRNEVQQYLASNSNNTFLWVSLVSQQLDKAAKRHARANLSKMPQDLDALYDRMLGQMLVSDDAVTCKDILAVVLAAYRPVNLAELVSLTASLEDFTNDIYSLQSIIGQCGSFLTLGPKDDVVYIIHQSAKDFLTQHAVGTIIPHGMGYQHRLLLSRSLEAMSKTLRSNIYHIESPGTLIDEITVPTPDPLQHVRYACANWTKHAQEGDLTTTEYGQVYSFLAEHYPHWLEAMSLLKSIYECIACISQLKSTVQTYAAIAFTPTQSIIRRLFSNDPGFLLQKPTMDEEWDACLQTLEATGPIAFSPSGAILASAGNDYGTIKCVRLWDVATGECLRTIEVQGRINSLAFSPSSNVLAIGGVWDSVGHGRSDKLYIWDLVTDQTDVVDLAFSNDGGRLASCTYNGLIIVWDLKRVHRLWSVSSGRIVRSIVFSRNGTEVMCAHESFEVTVWDAETGFHLNTIEPRGWKRHGPFLETVAFSGDLRTLAFGWFGGITLWDLTTGHLTYVSTVDKDIIRALKFSPDNAILASASASSPIKIWDVKTIQSVPAPVNNGYPIDSMAYSAEGDRLVSMSLDGIKLWDALTGQHLQTIPNPGYDIMGNDATSVTFSGNDIWLACSVRFDQRPRVQLWDATNRVCLQTVVAEEGTRSEVTALAFSSDSSLLAIAFVQGHEVLKLWDIAAGQWRANLSLDSFPAYLDLSGTGSTFHYSLLRTAFEDENGNPLIVTASSKSLCIPEFIVRRYDPWIKKNDKNVLWLPRDYRTLVFANRGSSVALGCKMGRVLFLRFA
ncbi:nacht and wd domain protein [Colletotrichum sojae]|uniref:Nacht and wd domain protein n=1 Tax=Colletotrichum sojae TaxID=2175907 RepID=A0A8H6IPY9_9PEZI|nr:nacht and wd domain protein [Colletotrichum sojae]